MTVPRVLFTAGTMILGFALALSVNAAGDPVAGEAKARTCLGCHGIVGYRNAAPAYNVPKLYGQHAEYLAAALKAYQSGQRTHATMRAQAHTLSDTDMQDLAAYFAGAGGRTAATR